MSDDILDRLTEAEKKRIRDQLPTDAEIMLAWGRSVLAVSPVERRVLVAAKIEVLDGLCEDPPAWCARALELAAAAEAGGRHAD